MKYDVISADGHIDLIWLPTDLFTKNASSQMKERMPYVVEGPKGPEWTSRNGAKFGLVNGMGSAGREYVPGIIHRSDRMASTGLYDDGKKGIRRLTDPDLRLKDQDLDGVQAEVLYGVLGSSGRLNDGDAACEMLRIYNDWLHDFCLEYPDRLFGAAMVAPQRLRLATTILLQLLGCLPGRAVDPLQHLILAIATPISTSNTHYFHRFDNSRIWNMTTTTQIKKVSMITKRNRSVF